MDSSSPPSDISSHRPNNIKWTSRLSRMMKSNRQYCQSQLQSIKKYRIVAKVHKVTVWVVSINFSVVILPLIFLLFLRLLSPHTELQLLVGVSLVLLYLACCCLSRHVWGDKDSGQTKNLKRTKSNQVIPSPSQIVKTQLFNLFIRIYPHIPFNAYSRLWGVINNTELPFPLSYVTVWLYARVAGCDREEAEHSSLLEYKTVGQFFTRRLKPSLRPVCTESDVVSPADGKMTYAGVFNGPYLQQVKGIKYHLKTFLGPVDDIEPLKYLDLETPCLKNAQNVSLNSIYEEQSKTKDDDIIDETGDKSTYTKTKDVPNKSDIILEDITPFLQSSPAKALYECVIYLSPADYHRFHSPASWVVHKRRHFPGSLHSVSPSIVEKIPGLFHTNERVAYLGRWQHGLFAFVAVGATGVGSIHINLDPNLNTNTRETKKSQYEEKVFETPVEVGKGEEFGHFKFGSTIVLLFEAPIELGFKMEGMTRVRVGQGLL